MCGVARRRALPMRRFPASPVGRRQHFRQLRLNQWVKQSVRWMPMRVWNQNDAPVDLSDLEGRVCYGGLDLASTTDITAFVLVFPPETGDERYVIAP